ncbi:hypothetical protein PHLGIDRAFT_335435 [Phlebiopsis gigantea 11061_1 CR5-6]|uniref:Uncharacterized protein n=1 Tax=Phlebiopsis gigantea (strain 11061_1 CR5-6) TaxID=745531 RepID=A0A0C3S2B9_PHLG1|nr:hypothetical protein PHLGIDRAFT_335435 [Phlebiopsis gigantea 11061_1 CR5-6]
MKRLLRDRKSSLSSKSKPVIVSGPTALSATPPTETPLYARFASSQQRQDGHNKPVVSGPAGLSSKTSFSRGTSSAGRQHGQEGHSNVLRRKQSRQEQVQSTPQVISSPPARSSSRVAPHLSSSPPKQSSYAQGHEPRQGQPLYSQSTEATASSSRTPLHARTQSGPLYSINPSQTTFPQMQSSESWRDRTQPTLPQAGLSGLQVSEMTDKMDSFDSDSELQPPRFLVVRNGDPETSSTTSRSSSVPRDPAPPVNERTPTKVRPTSQYSPQSTTPLDRAGFTLHDHGIQPLPSHVSATQAPRSEPISTASPSWTQYPNTASNAASYTPSRQAPQPDIAQTESPSFPMASSSSSPSFQSQRKPAPSLLATPSFTRKKYSPLAAFGLPVSANTSMTTSSSMQGEPVSRTIRATFCL